MSGSMLSQAEIDALLAQIPASVDEENQDGRSKLIQPQQTASEKIVPPGSHPNLERILDIPLQVKVTLGQGARSVKDVLNLMPGAIVEFERNVSEPVDIMLNGKLIARGEVVVVEEHFGVRVTQIISPLERVRKMV
ncbi:MAG: flagellar motor switch protein FliN [Dethiobacter sp.]|jgi:flagellar motor switch protein FliN/FliY|nr:flagellar motor switch protein FliN [Dethiobacter sp.]MBS3902205.1 flagellar motor switch protein FliN [Dethiobacter sp.]MBS3988445.1 flagellar motor switch protein FliN [Dethiobacter sp.]